MAFLQVKNNASSILASGIAADALELSVAAGEGARFPASNFHITIEDEILKCSTRAGDTLTVTRAQEGTAAAAHVTGKSVRLNITAAIITELQQGTLFSKMLHVARDMAANSGDVSYTGAGFTPTALICFAAIFTTTFVSWGIADSAKANRTIEEYEHGAYSTGVNIAYLSAGGANSQVAIVKSYDADGFTLTWTKTGSPTGSALLEFLCLR